MKVGNIPCSSVTAHIELRLVRPKGHSITMIANPERLLHTFGTAASMPGLAFDRNGVASFEIDGRVTMSVEQSADSQLLHLYAPLCRVPEDAGPDYARHLLHLNYDLSRFHFATLAIDESTDEVILLRTFVLEGASEAGFVRVMTELVCTARDLSADLMQGNVARAQASERSATSPPAGPKGTTMV